MAIPQRERCPIGALLSFSVPMSQARARASVKKSSGVAMLSRKLLRTNQDAQVVDAHCQLMHISDENMEILAPSYSHFFRTAKK
jgi:hypothetical protein